MSGSLSPHRPIVLPFVPTFPHVEHHRPTSRFDPGHRRRLHSPLCLLHSCRVEWSPSSVPPKVRRRLDPDRPGSYLRYKVPLSWSHRGKGTYPYTKSKPTTVVIEPQGMWDKVFKTLRPSSVPGRVQTLCLGWGFDRRCLYVGPVPRGPRVPYTSPTRRLSVGSLPCTKGPS